MVLCFCLSLQTGSGMSCFQRGWMRGWSQWSLTHPWLPERNNLSVPWELILEQGELGRLLALLFSLDITWIWDGLLLVLDADWKKDAASLKIEA